MFLIKPGIYFKIVHSNQILNVKTKKLALLNFKVLLFSTDIELFCVCNDGQICDGQKSQIRNSIIVKRKNKVLPCLSKTFSFIKRYFKYSQAVLDKTLNMNQKINRCKDMWDKILFLFVEIRYLQWHVNNNHFFL